jgi:hypothetical protein
VREEKAGDSVRVWRSEGESVWEEARAKASGRVCTCGEVDGEEAAGAKTGVEAAEDTEGA